MSVIVGAGAAGLSLGLMVDGPIYEKEPGPGGLCRSTFVDGFTFDQGPHILGGIPEAVSWVLEHTPIAFSVGETRNRGWRNGDYCPHPFENPDIGGAYMAKMWKYRPAELSLPGLTAQAGRKPGGVSTFRYPLHGGYQAITDCWAEQLDAQITYDAEVEDYAGPVVWTGPVDGPYNDLVTVTAGFEGVAPDLTAIYLPEAWSPFHRLSFPSAFSPNNAPHGCWSVQGEVSLRGGTAPPAPALLVEALRAAVARIGLTHDDPIMEHVRMSPNAYPVPLAGRPPTVRGHGRTGGHRYLNVDGVVAESLALTSALTARR